MPTLLLATTQRKEVEPPASAIQCTADITHANTALSYNTAQEH